MENYQKILCEMTPKELGLYASNKLRTGFPAFTPDDYTLMICAAFKDLSESDLKEMVGYANHLAEKSGLGKDFYKVDPKAKPPIFTKSSDSLEEKCEITSNAAAA